MSPLVVTQLDVTRGEQIHRIGHPLHVAAEAVAEAGREVDEPTRQVPIHALEVHDDRVQGLEPIGDLLEASFPGRAPNEEPYSTVTFVGRLEGRRWMLKDPEATYSVILLIADRDALPNSPSDVEVAEAVANSLLLSLGAAHIKAVYSTWKQQPAAHASGS